MAWRGVAGCTAPGEQVEGLPGRRPPFSVKLVVGSRHSVGKHLRGTLKMKINAG